MSFDTAYFEPLTKRPKHDINAGSFITPKISPSWKLYATESFGPEGKMFGLQDIFFTRNVLDEHQTNMAGTANQNQFYTFRMEHRQGGPMSKFRGEERILLFRSDRAGAIAKIIYSSEAPEEHDTKVPESLPLIQGGSRPNFSTAHAKIHVLDVKAPYRGRDLGGLLFSEAITSLKSLYCNDDDDEVDEGSDKGEKKQLYDVECSLDAEEDITRHGKLVKFYEELGCRVKSSGRVQYVNNNDSETYRKIPMQIDLHSSNQKRSRQRRKKISQLASLKSPFLPVQLIGTMGKLLIRSHKTRQDIKLDWLLSECSEGIQFISTHGHILIANPNGDVTALSSEDQDCDSSDLDADLDELKKWSYFVPCHVSEQDRSHLNSKDLWVVRTNHGTFLTANSFEHTLSCTRLPSFWQPNGDNISLVCTSDTPPRRHHYRKSWKFQTYEYVRAMRSKFLKFSLGHATVFQALNWIHQFPANPFHIWSHDEGNSSPSLRTLSFLMAEAARDEGMPDWVQLVALFHELGEAVKVLDLGTKDMAESVYDWTISSRSRIVGCKVPECAGFGEFRHLNMDEDNSRYNTDVGVYTEHCGLDNVWLVWSGSEYTYHLFKHNSCLPSEGLAMIRYYLLGDWHEKKQYQAITNDDDAEVLSFVSDFDALRRRVRLKCMDLSDLSDEQCQSLWDDHYAVIATKYGCDHVFDW